MLVSHDREKLLNAIIYFVRKTKYCHTLKLFKLLNFLDFEHYRQTGRTVTGLHYSAWPMGPAPNELWHEIVDGGGGDFRENVTIINDAGDKSRHQLRTIDDDEWDERDAGHHKKRTLKPRRNFNKSIFTKRELIIMDRLAEFFKELRANDMKEFSHMKGLPWRKVFRKGEGNGQPIPPELALESEPILQDMPTIDPEELRYREALLEGL